jgi:NADPH:quinone reductase-like Zn-dependent oxidoreductase
MRLRNRIFIGIGATIALAIATVGVVLSYESACPPLAMHAIEGADSMRAVMQRCYGDPGVLRVERIQRPDPSAGQLLIQVHAASVNPFEWHMTTGRPYLVKLFRGLGAPDSPRTGSDFAGVIAAVGAGVTRFKVGDEVFGGRNGALADYVVADESGDIALKPAALSFEQAAALPIAGVTALQALRDHGGIKPGQKVLINGASGGVGTYAVQIAKAHGAEVTGVCSTRNVELVRSLGADHVIDYTQQDFTKGAERYDLIFDTAGNHDMLDLRDALTPSGILVGIGGSKTEAWLGPVWRMVKRKVLNHFVEQKLVSFVASVTPAELEALATLASEGKLRSVIDRRYTLEQTSEALEYIGTRRARGKVIVTVN